MWVRRAQPGLLMLGLIVCSSCGGNKSRYEIDSLIEDFAVQDVLAGEEPSPQVPPEMFATAEAKAKAEEEFAVDSAEVAEEEKKESEEAAPSAPVERIRVRNLGRLAEVFNDSNYRQYAYAEKLGIAPITSLAQAYHTRRPVVKVTSNSDYTVDELTHSLPYLVPEAERLLSAIGRNFQDSLKKRGNARYRIRATSLLRTPATVKKLRRVNINATDSSTHQFGTTFDISYHRFHCLDERYQVSQEDLKNLLGEVLYDLREEGRCLVKFERKTGCYHVTATK